MKKYFGYIRVSTQKQGEKGSSLSEQRDAILNYAKRSGWVISEWYEEQETAAKLGRKQFHNMLGRLRHKHADGVVLHKIDRGARNLKDWAELAALMDSGIDVQFAYESLDLNSRGGRLSADIQAVVAADFIRNLRDEVKKGMYGRLKQGLYPWAAPSGYLDSGKASVKMVDPIRAPLIREAFRLYATGEFSMKKLLARMNQSGLTTIKGKPLHLNNLSVILRNPFYYGLMQVKGQTYLGIHEPLISVELFREVEAIRTSRKALPIKKDASPSYLFQRMLTCRNCSYGLYAEFQKGHVYYRCQRASCKGTSLNEKTILKTVIESLSQIAINTPTNESLRQMYELEIQKNQQETERKIVALRLMLSQLSVRITRLTDAFLECSIEREDYEERKRALLDERISLTQRISEITFTNDQDTKRFETYLELTPTLYSLGELENQREKRQLLKLAISNFTIFQKDIDITWSKPYQVLFDCYSVLNGAPERDASRKKNSSIQASNSAEASALINAIINFKELDDFELF